MENIKTKKPILSQIQPKSISEILNSPFERFMIKFGVSHCKACNNFDNLIKNNEKFVPKNDTGIYFVQLDSDKSDIAERLKPKFHFQSIPHCVVTNKSLETIDSITGFDKKGFIKLFENNFK